jgi:hypothetical protein
LHDLWCAGPNPQNPNPQKMKGFEMNTISTQLDYKIELIGEINNGDYVDQYFKITRLDDDLNYDDVYTWLRDEHYYDTNRMGGWFCHTVTICPNPYHADTCIGIVHHSQNV